MTKKFTWTYLGTKTGTAALSLPSSWNELFIAAVFANPRYGFTFLQTKVAYTAGNPYTLMNGHYWNSNDYHFCAVNVTNGGVALLYWYFKNVDYTSQCSIKVWYR